MFYSRILNIENEVIQKYGFENEVTIAVFRITNNAKQAYESGFTDTANDFLKQAQDELFIADLKREKGFL